MVDPDRSSAGLPAGDRGGSLLPVTAVLALALLVGTCSARPGVIEQARLTGELRVATRIGPTSYYTGAAGPEGLEHELATRFAAMLHVRPRFLVLDTADAVLAEVGAGRAHLGAAGLAMRDGVGDQVRYSIPYQRTKLYVVYHRDHRRPARLEDLAGRRIAVTADSPQAAALAGALAEVPTLTFSVLAGVGTEELLGRVAAGEIDATVADANEFLLSRATHPQLRAAFILGDPELLAWALPAGDRPLAAVAEHFLTGIKAQMPLLIARYYDRAEPLDRERDAQLLEHAKARLPLLQPIFEKVASETAEDWRVLAAIGYQESQWDPGAVSPTGVRGLMMLTAETAADLGITDRANAEQSIRGGALYLREMRNAIPERVPEPDRTWFALAAYNIGYAHLEDARVLAQSEGGDPNSWRAVKPYLALLGQERYYSRAKRGYARGWEAARFVELVRDYVERLHRLAPDPPGGLSGDGA
jgi:membrane-bound lytic murein transglycosylase F